MYLTAIEVMHTLQNNRIQPLRLAPNGDLDVGAFPPTRCNGFYWIYTSYTLEELVQCNPSYQQGAVQIPLVAAIHGRLAKTCRIEVDGFRVVYNGIGGVGPKRSGGLRERICGEFTGGQGTGSLGVLRSSLNDLTKWRFSYVLWEELSLDTPLPYAKANAIPLERGWRLQYGWPLLCTG
jgi:hypothetical protein